MATFDQFRSTFPEDSNEKGEAFEVFLAEWLFKNHPVLSSQFKKVWRFSDWPKAWSGKDIGTDLIAEDYNGKICAIQAKFYKEESSIPKGDVDSFLSDSARSEIDYRYLIATTDRIGLNATVTIEGQEKPVHMFLLSDFLDPFNWPRSLTSLNKHKPRKPHKPKPHQRKAINAVTKKLEDRGQLIMACGTGKTLTGQRIAEKLECKTTLVLLPSLLLLSKTVKDWITEREQDFIFLPVCSDQSVTRGTDEIAISQSELAFRSTTDETEIAEFLRRKGKKVIFSTYQSSDQIAEAYKQGRLKPFDLILADEAHRCAGKVSAESGYSTVLDSKKIPAKRRLFMTATPRMYTSNLRRKAKEADIQIASMDDEAVFGPVLHRLTFGQAIANDPPLLTDYRVLVVGVNEASYREMVKERTLVTTESGVEDDARSLATQLGLSKAVRDYDLKRVISFHSRVNLARDFARSFLEFQSDLKAKAKPKGKLTYSHVSGTMPTSERSKRLRALGALEEQDRYLLGNARCLSEGVDVPALDGVAFVDPKRSEIDIIQAVGRAIRLSEGKETGTIIIPVFLSDSDDPDEVLSASEFDQVWKVVNALRSHDESLGEMLDQFRAQLGRKQKVSFKNTKIVFDVPKRISDEFVEAFDTKLVETTTESWSFLYGLLIEYIQEFDHCNIPAKSRYLGWGLGAWVGTQRQNYKNDRLSEKRVKLLEDVGFSWDPFQEAWERGFTNLRLFKKEFGHCNPSAKSSFSGFKIGTWVHSQRSNRNSLPENKLQRLDALGFEWDPIEAQWKTAFEALRDYQKEFGDCLVKRGLKHKGLNLSLWVGTQRSNKTKLTKEKLGLLNSIGFIWDVRDYLWHETFDLLAAHQKEFGTCFVPSKERKLNAWVEAQRSKKNTLSKNQIRKLDQIGFEWDPLSSKWEKYATALIAYKKEFGNSYVPHDYLFRGLRLGAWLSRQRGRKSELSKMQVQRLNKLGIKWDARESSWDLGFAALVSYKTEFGNCLVTAKSSYKGVALGAWVDRQRQSFKEKKLEKKRIAKLNKIGFAWAPDLNAWEAFFKILSEYAQEHGDCLVPATLIYGDVKLGSWVRNQRNRKRRLTKEQVNRLNELGFVWQARKKER